MTDRRLPIVVDVGNSRARAARPRGEQTRHDPESGWSRGRAWQRLGSWATPPAGDAATLMAAVAECVVTAGPGPVIVASVVPHITAAYATAGTAVHVVTARWSLPFALDVKEPQRVGADRLCNMAAAVGAGLDSAIVVDVGTATTIDILEDGRFVGGFIAAGMALAAGALAAGTAQLPQVEFTAGPLEPGRDTVEAMARGSYHVAIEGVRGVVSRLAATQGDPPVVVTGGLADHLADVGLVDPDWTLRGALELARQQGLVAG